MLVSFPHYLWQLPLLGRYNLLLWSNLLAYAPLLPYLVDLFKYLKVPQIKAGDQILEQLITISVLPRILGTYQAVVGEFLLEDRVHHLQYFLGRHIDLNLEIGCICYLWRMSCLEMDLLSRNQSYLPYLQKLGHVELFSFLHNTRGHILKILWLAGRRLHWGCLVTILRYY